MQAEQQKLVGAAEDMEQHSLDMQGLMLDVAAPVEAAMLRFSALVFPGREPPPPAASVAALNKTCVHFQECLNALLARGLQPLGLPKAFSNVHGQIMQYKDSLNAWCYPLLKLKAELEHLAEEGDGKKSSSIVPAGRAATKDKGDAGAAGGGGAAGGAEGGGGVGGADGGGGGGGKGGKPPSQPPKGGAGAKPPSQPPSLRGSEPRAAEALPEASGGRAAARAAAARAAAAAVARRRRVGRRRLAVWAARGAP